MATYTTARRSSPASTRTPVCWLSPRRSNPQQHLTVRGGSIHSTDPLDPDGTPFLQPPASPLGLFLGAATGSHRRAGQTRVHKAQKQKMTGPAIKSLIQKERLADARRAAWPGTGAAPHYLLAGCSSYAGARGQCMAPLQLHLNLRATGSVRGLARRSGRR